MFIIEWVEDFKRDVRSPKKLMSYILNALEEGKYLEFRLNEFFLPGRRAYMIQNFIHINLVVGLDSSRSTLFMAGYDGSYAISRVAFRDFIRAFYDYPKNTGFGFLKKREYHDQTPWRRFIWLWKPSSEKSAPGLKLSELASQLSDYINSIDTSKNNRLSISDEYNATNEKGAWGIETYSYWGRYLEAVERDPNMPFDVRATRTFWEHKHCMLARAIYLKDQNIIIDNNILNSLTDIAALGKKVRFYGYLFRDSRRESYLQCIKLCLNEARILEQSVLPKLLEAVSISMQTA